MLDLDQLRALRAVCETGGFTSAANTLNVTQSTISHQIRRLEEGVGRRLLERTTRTVRPTVEGELLLLDARRILDMIAQAEARLTSEPMKGEVRLGVPEEIASGALPGVLARFRSLQPDVRVAVTVGISRSLRSAVDQDNLDVAILKEVPARSESLGTTQLVWAGAERLISERVIPLAFFPEPCVLRTYALRLLENEGRRYEIVMTSTSNQSLRSVAKAELALTILAPPDCPPEIRLNQSRIGLPALPEMGYSLHVRDGSNTVIAYLKDIISACL